MTSTKSPNTSSIKSNNGFEFSLGELIDGILFDIYARFKKIDYLLTVAQVGVFS